MEKGNIVWLNGTSSSGKTTIGKLVQALSINHYFYLSYDLINEMNDKKRLDLNFVIFESENGMILAHMAKMFSDLGYNIIVDSVFWDNPQIQHPEVLYKTAEILKDSPTFLIKVICPEEELKRRESNRGDRHIGQASAQLNDLIPREENAYDYILNNYNRQAEESVCELLEILPLLQSNAFNSIRNARE